MILDPPAVSTWPELLDRMRDMGATYVDVTMTADPLLIFSDEDWFSRAVSQTAEAVWDSFRPAGLSGDQLRELHRSFMEGLVGRLMEVMRAGQPEGGHA
jgi:hypothetical protein